MFDLTRILLEAQGGEVLHNLAKQFGLGPDQTRKAVEAMMPAFALAMQRQMTDPKALQTLFGMMTGQAAAPRNPYLDAMTAFSPDSVKAGQDALLALFGSNEATRAIAQQVALMSGIGQNVAQSMFPVVASMLMGGLGTSLAKDPMGQMLTAMFGGSGPVGAMEQMSAMMTSAATESAAKAPALMADVMTQMMKAVPRPTGETETFEEMLKRAPNPTGPQSAFDETFGAFIRGFNRGRPEAEPESETPFDEFGKMVGQMFQAGQTAQAAQVHAFETILDQFWGKR